MSSWPPFCEDISFHLAVHDLISWKVTTSRDEVTIILLAIWLKYRCSYIEGHVQMAFVYKWNIKFSRNWYFIVPVTVFDISIELRATLLHEKQNKRLCESLNFAISIMIKMTKSLVWLVLLPITLFIYITVFYPIYKANP